MVLLAVIDTNVLVSSFITKNPMASTRRVVNSMLNGEICPLYNDEILEEYSEVLHRPKFHLSGEDISCLLQFIKCKGLNSKRFPYDGDMLDEDDRMFYEIALSEEESFLVTGNLKHYPSSG